MLLFPIYFRPWKLGQGNWVPHLENRVFPWVFVGAFRVKCFGRYDRNKTLIVNPRVATVNATVKSYYLNYRTSGLPKKIFGAFEFR